MKSTSKLTGIRAILISDRRVDCQFYRRGARVQAK
jgi:hypothetical protein